MNIFILSRFFFLHEYNSWCKLNWKLFIWGFKNLSFWCVSFDTKCFFTGFFRTVLGLQQDWQEGRKVSHMPRPAHQMARILPGMELHWRIITTPLLKFTPWSTLGVVYSVGLDGCIMIHHHCNIAEYFHCFTILCACRIHPSSPLLPWQLLVFLLSPWRTSNRIIVCSVFRSSCFT